MGKYSDSLLGNSGAAKPGETPKPDGTCAYNDHGITCTSRGTISAGTLGGGAWYCRQHAWVILNDPGPIKQPKRDTVQADAAAYCAANGLTTVDQMREFCKRKAKSIGKLREPGADEGEETTMPSTNVEAQNRDT